MDVYSAQAEEGVLACALEGDEGRPVQCIVLVTNVDDRTTQLLSGVGNSDDRDRGGRMRTELFGGVPRHRSLRPRRGRLRVHLQVSIPQLSRRALQVTDLLVCALLQYAKVRLWRMFYIEHAPQKLCTTYSRAREYASVVPA